MIPKPAIKSRSRPSDPIGVFDSGVGGLSVLRELECLLPHERFVFLADQSHVPYGGKTPSQLKSLAARSTRFLLARRCKAIVVACNTATCYAIEHLRRSFSVPFVGTVPAIKPAVALTKNGIIGSISTPATAKSPTLKRLIREHAKGVRVIVVGCPGLEDLVETGGVRSPQAKALLETYLARITAAGADTLVLGCTHYPFLKRTIRTIAPSLQTVDSGRAIARRTRALVHSLALLRPSGRGSSVFYTTGQAKAMASVSSELLGRRISARTTRI